MTTSKNNLLKIAILTMSLVQLGTNGVSPILQMIGESFPDASNVSVQFLMTFPSIFCLIFVLVSAFMAEKLPKKTLALLGLIITGIGGLMAVLFHESLAILYVWAGVIGIGLGMVAPIGPALINETYTGSEQHTMLGWQSSASTIGGMLMTFAGGFLAVMGWNYGYLVYLMGIPGIIFTLIGVKGNQKYSADKSYNTEKQNNKREHFRLLVWREMIIAVLFLTVYSAIPVNMSMLVNEYGIGGSSLAGTMSMLFMLTGMLMGLVFGLFTNVFKKMTNVMGILFLAAGCFLMGFTSSTVSVAIGAMIAGTSMSTVMPTCMAAAGKLKGYETINTALIMASSYVGVFIAPVITSLSSAVTGAENVSYRYVVMGVMSVIIAAIAVLLKIETKNKHAN